jgi:hypothetical protein
MISIEVNASLAGAKFRARLIDLGSNGLTGSAADFAQHIADETEKWGKVIRLPTSGRSDRRVGCALMSPRLV